MSTTSPATRGRCGSRAEQGLCPHPHGAMPRTGELRVWGGGLPEVLSEGGHGVLTSRDSLRRQSVPCVPHRILRSRRQGALIKPKD